LSNKQNDIIYDNIGEAEPMSELTDMVEEMLDRSITMAEWQKLSDWLLKTQLNQVEVCKKLALKAISSLTTDIKTS